MAVGVRKGRDNPPCCVAAHVECLDTQPIGVLAVHDHPISISVIHHSSGKKSSGDLKSPKHVKCPDSS